MYFLFTKPQFHITCYTPVFLVSRMCSQLMRCSDLTHMYHSHHATKLLLMQFPSLTNNIFTDINLSYSHVILISNVTRDMYDYTIPTHLLSIHHGAPYRSCYQIWNQQLPIWGHHSGNNGKYCHQMVPPNIMIWQLPTEYNDITTTHRVQWCDNYPYSTRIWQLPVQYKSEWHLIGNKQLPNKLYYKWNQCIIVFRRPQDTYSI